MTLEIQCEPDGLLKVFDKSETAEIEKKWMSVFCKQRQGLGINRFKWHIFSAHAYPSLEADAARKAYDSMEETRYIVMGNNHESAIMTSKKPLSCNLSDYYVFPANMAWTMACSASNTALP